MLTTRQSLVNCVAPAFINAALLAAHADAGELDRMTSVLSDMKHLNIHPDLTLLRSLVKYAKVHNSVPLAYGTLLLMVDRLVIELRVVTL